MRELATSALPLDEHQNSRLHDAVTGLTPAQLQWVSGYAAGLAATGNLIQATAVEPASQSGAQLTVLIGSQTGNGVRIAENLVAIAQDRGFPARALNLSDFKPAALKRERFVTLVISTHGEGDPPDDAELFHEYLMSERAVALPDLSFSVLALGDSSYVNFCQTGRELDARLAELGAQRFKALVECDLAFDEAANRWSSDIIDHLQGLSQRSPERPATRLHSVASEPMYGPSNPFPAEVLVNQKITGAGSSKDVRHLELSIEGSDLSYEAGDALAVITSNPPPLVDQFMDVLALDGAQLVDVDEKPVALIDALRDHLEITVVTVPFLRKWAARSNNEVLQRLLLADDLTQLTEFIASHQVIDVVRRHPTDVDAQAFVDMLRKLGSRSYSIASGPSANPGEVHLTVAAVRYEAFEQPHWGAASTMLADRITEGEKVSVFVEKNSRFRLPAPDVPIIMIGPGTGIAPFRAFVEERVEQDAQGESWLFFGDRTKASDFLYQLEWLRHLEKGNLDRLEVAFSRDQDKKIYVQDRIRAHGAELFRWIERGAVIYVCGDAKAMARDVEMALIDVLAEHAGIDRDSAATRLKLMRREKRYQRDVY